MLDFLSFRRMITPVLIHLLFWIGFGVSVIGGVLMIIEGINGSQEMLYYGIALIAGGPLAVRIACESLILFFRMNETLTDIANANSGITPNKELKR